MVGVSPPGAVDWTIREIEQQPAMWEETARQIAGKRQEICSWLGPLLARDDLRIILTGAGSSAYIGEALAPALAVELERTVDAISTTTIVADPGAVFSGREPRLLVSFARSGNSPESVAAVNLSDACSDEIFHLIICCNSDSELARYASTSPRALLLVMPSATLDQSFAMTSSFTSMCVAALLALSQRDPGIGPAADAARELLADGNVRTDIQTLVGQELERVIFLGSGALQGIAREAALKVLELSAGSTDSYFESALGFRHGPKFLAGPTAIVVSLPSTHSYTARYDDDMHSELERDARVKQLIRLDRLPGVGDTNLPALLRGLVYLVWCQLLAYHNALSRGISPDNPSPTGEVNRVVQGVIIHSYETI